MIDLSRYRDRVYFWYKDEAVWGETAVSNSKAKKCDNFSL